MTKKPGFLFGGLAAISLMCPCLLNADAGRPLTSPSLSPANMTAQWWQWAFSMPNVSTTEGDWIHPLVGDDSTSGEPGFYESCGNGQHGDLWFLGGDFAGTGEPFERTCTIPFGKTIVLAVINVECSTAEGDATAGDPVKQQADDLKDCAESIGNDLSGTAAFGPIGGDLQEVRVERLSTVNAFPLWISPSNVAGLEDPITPNPSLSQADGQWVILRNLQPGFYRLEFSGVYISPDVFELNGAYNLEIAKPNGDTAVE